MTLGIVFSSGGISGCVIDRKLTGSDSRIPDEKDAEKCGGVRFSDSTLVYCYAGLAASPWDGMKTHELLAEVICGSGEGGVTHLIALKRVAEELTRRFSKLQVSLIDRRLTVVFTGFAENSDSGLDQVLATISNFELPGTLASPGRRFQLE